MNFWVHAGSQYHLVNPYSFLENPLAILRDPSMNLTVMLWPGFRPRTTTSMDLLSGPLVDSDGGNR